MVEEPKEVLPYTNPPARGQQWTSSSIDAGFPPLLKHLVLKISLEGIVWPKYHLFAAIQWLESMNMV